MVWIIQPTQVPKHPKVKKYFGISNINVYQNMRNKTKKKIVHEWWSGESEFSAYGTTQGCGGFPCISVHIKTSTITYVTKAWLALQPQMTYKAHKSKQVQI